MNKTPSRVDMKRMVDYFGMSREISPDIAALHMLLESYYQISATRQSINDKINGCIQGIEQNPFVYCKETDSLLRDEIFSDLRDWLQSYCFTGRQRDRYPIPFDKKLIYRENKERNDLFMHLLYQGLEEKLREEQFKADQKALDAYLFLNESDVYFPMTDLFTRMIFQNDREPVKKKTEPPELDGLDASYFDSPPMKDLRRRFGKDFRNHLMSPLFKPYDSFRRLNSLMLLLNFYTTIYMVFRAMNGGPAYILAKGSADLSSSESTLHSAALSSFSDIRERIFQLSEEYYCDAIKSYLSRNKSSKRKTSDMLCMYVQLQEKSLTIKIENLIWEDLRDSLTSARAKEVLDQIVIDYLQLGETKTTINVRDLAKAFVDYSKKRASSARKVSAIFGVQGQQAKFVYPRRNSSHKYYAMSQDLTELFLRLYLADQAAPGVYSAPLDDFTEWLSREYGIYICYSSDLVSFLRSRSIKAPIFSDFEQNRIDFINTLDNLGALEKRSDNSYIVEIHGIAGGQN